MSQDDLDHIPSIVPTRDGSPTRSAGNGNAAKGRSRSRGASVPVVRSGAGVAAWLVIVVALSVAAAASYWAWQLRTQLEQTNKVLFGHQMRIANLEDRLSDTDEGMSQNAEVQAAKIKELDSEVRKLWDNVWKETKDRLAKLEASSASQDKAIKAVSASVAGVQSQVEAASGDIGKLKSVAGDLSRLMTSAQRNQAEVERVADTLNRIDLDMARLAKRVEGNEEWVGSINAFRKQVNASLAELQSAVRGAQ